jgi:hypothetical protein
MGLMDRVKAQATQLAQKTQEAAAEGKARLDQAQANRKGDGMLRNLGALVYAHQTGRGTADSQSKIDSQIQEIQAHERENGLNLGEQDQSGQTQASGVPQQGFPPDQPTTFPQSAPETGTEPGPTGTGESSAFPPEA